MYMNEDDLQEWISQRRELGEAVAKLKAQFEDTLWSIRKVKQRIVATQDFELAAWARNIEKILEESRDELKGKLG